MPPKRKSERTAPTRKRRRPHQREAVDDGIPEVYGEMLAEAAVSSPSLNATGSATKRRKVIEEQQLRNDLDLWGSPGSESTADLPMSQQIVYDEFEGSEESEDEFEDVELEPSMVVGRNDEQADQKPLQLDLSKPTPDTPRRAISRRKPASFAERQLRLEVHKAHLICLLAHLRCRNRWCDREEIHVILRPLVPRKVISLLHVEESKPQYQRSHSFNNAIEEICAIWRSEWKITARGMRRAYWKEDVDAVKESEEAEDLVDFEDFKQAAKTRTGSRDLGAQLFCALLRAVAVACRLVCSLQVLPFSGVAKGQTPEKPKPDYIHAPAQTYTQYTTITRPGPVHPTPAKRIVESPFPIFWVEVLSPATLSWIPLDPIVRNTINKPRTGFDPPASDHLNSMSYVIAFEDDGSARDVTRRYSQWYNAKTRKSRVERTKGGEQWWAQTMKVLRKPFPEDRDEIEDAEFVRRAECEPMPRNVQDFKGHPVYVLERHLRTNEVVYPRRESGKISTGTGKNAKVESVFNRRNVHLCRTADAWYRRGRDIKEGEQPLKRVLPQRRREDRAASQEDHAGEEAGMALYAEYQTDLYQPPAVTRGRLPRNAYGNLDVYVPTMIPAGAIHVRHPLAAKAARILGIDYADAVTGFEFKGRQGTAVVDGVVVIANQRDAMVSVIEGLESEAIQEVEQERGRAILRIWKRWLTALRVREKIEREYGDKADNEHSISVDEDEDEDNDQTYDHEDDGGGFVPEAEEKDSKDMIAESQPSLPNLKPVDQLLQLPRQPVHHDIIVVESPNKLPESPPPEVGAPDSGAAVEAGGFFPEADEQLRYHSAKPSDASIGIDNRGGGFLVEDEDHMAGPDNVPSNPNPDDISDQGGGGFFVDDDDHQSPPFLQGSTRNEDVEHAGDGFIHETGNPGDVTVSSSTNQRRPIDHASYIITTDTPIRQEEPTPADNNDAAAVSSFRPPNPEHHHHDDDDDTQSHGSTSLLSHDPAEDDAEPEWLLESLGDD